MKIIIDKANRAIWHRDCSQNKFKSGVIQEIEHDNSAKKTLIKCLHCKMYGYIPVGAQFGIEINIEPRDVASDD